MRGIRPGEIWVIDFGLAAKVRPALLLTGEPAAMNWMSSRCCCTRRRYLAIVGS
jgi:hypothetical protein